VIVKLFLWMRGMASRICSTLFKVLAIAVKMLTGSHSHYDVTKNSSRDPYSTPTNSSSNNKRDCQSEGDGHIDVPGCIRLFWAANITFPRSVTQMDGDLEDIRYGVMGDHREVQDHDEGQEDICGDEGSIAIDDEDDECNDLHDQGRQTENESWFEC
jgi:hypothetical protein